MLAGERLRGVVWTVVLLAALVLLAATLSLSVRSDFDARPRVAAFLLGDQAMVVLHAEPELDAGIAGLLARLSRVTVVEFDPVRHPGWALVESGDESGWVPLDRLSARP